MRKKLKQGKRQTNKIRTRLLAICAVLSIFVTVTACILVYININNNTKTKASSTGFQGGGNDLGTGEIISEFTWEKNPVTIATLGPDGSKVNKEAHSMPDNCNAQREFISG